MSSPVCHRVNGRVYSHIPRNKHPPSSSQSPEMVALTPPKISFTHLSLQPAFLWKQAKPPTNKPTCSTSARAPPNAPSSTGTEPEQNQALGILRDRQDARRVHSLENLHTIQLFLWLGHSLKAWNYLVIKEAKHEKAIHRKPGFITSTAGDTTLKTGREKKGNIGTSSDGASNIYLEIYCPE